MILQILGYAGVLLTLGLIIFIILIFTVDEVFNDVFGFKLDPLKTKTADEYKLVCETEKDVLKAASKVLEDKIKEKEAVLAIETKKYNDLVAQGSTTVENAKKELQILLDKANAELKTIKAELEKQVALSLEKDATLAQIKTDLANKRVCARINGVRKNGGAEGDQVSTGYGSVQTLEGCEKLCKDDTNCKQFVWSGVEGGEGSCYPMIKAYDAGSLGTGWVSGTCSN